MVDVRHDTHRSAASYEYHTSLARRQLDDGEFAFTSQQLGVGTGRTGHSGPLTGVEFNVVDDRTQGNLAQEERVSDLGSDACAAHDGLAHLESVGCDDVALLTVGVYQECDACGTIGVVLDRFYSCGDAVLRAFEVDVTIHLLVTAADVADRHLAVVVTSTRALLGAEQRFLRFRRRDLVERADNLMSRTCGYRFKFSYCHLR